MVKIEIEIVAGYDNQKKFEIMISRVPVVGEMLTSNDDEVYQVKSVLHRVLPTNSYDSNCVVAQIKVS